MTVEEMREIALIAMSNELRRVDPEGKGNGEWVRDVQQAMNLLVGTLLVDEKD